MTELTAQQRADLDIARALANAGIPIFLAYPDADAKTGFKPPKHWQQTAPDPAVVDQWRPELALCAVMGCGLDLVDIDPRNGGSPASLNGTKPTVYGIAATPSDGNHLLIRSLGVGSRDNVYPGIDVKGGLPDGAGRGFAFLAPTVRLSKVTGELVPYRWQSVPDPAVWTQAIGDTSGEALAARIRDLRAHTAHMSKGAGGPDWWRKYMESREPQSAPAAERAIAAKLSAVAEWGTDAGIGFRTVLLRAALTLGGYVGGGYLDEQDARERLEGAVEKVWGAPDDDDSLWIQQGLDDGAVRPFYVDTKEQAEEQEVQHAGARPAPLSDAMLAQTVADCVLADRFCWTSGLGWLQWTGQRWRRCEEPAVTEVIRQHFVDMVVRAAKNDSDPDAIKRLSALLSSNRISSVTRLAKGIVLADAAHFDQRPDLLNTPTGVVDLITGELSPHDPAYLMTKITGVGYDPQAHHPDWDKALQALPEDVRPWYQARLGQAITGHTPPDDVLVVNQGGGENGKTTVVGPISKALGDYYVLVSDRVLLADPGAHPTEFMDLRGARLAVIEETPEARRLSVARLKKVVGTPEIKARYIRQDSITFTATHSLFVSTNYRPMVEETDHGTWRRLLLVRFPYRFVKPGQPRTGADDREGDPTLRERLRRDERAQQAALRWLVDGARRWYANGRVMPPPPEVVVTDTGAWRCESDVILAYVEDRLVFDPTRHVVATELLDDVNRWLLSHGQRTWSDKTFAARFGDHDEVAAHRVKKVRLSNMAGVSWAPQYGLPRATERYMAWTGVRFADGTDGPSEQGKGT